MNGNRIGLTALAGLLALLAGCAQSEGGIGGTGATSYGSVSEIGSIFVNGVEYDTAGATILLADDSTSFVDETGDAGGNDLKKGMVVKVQGAINADGVTGKATTVTYADNLEGPVSSSDSSTNTFTVLGQTIIYDNLSRSKTGEILTSAPNVDDWVEVSGFVDPNGNIRATYVENKGRGVVGEYELKGEVSGTPSANTFPIGTLTVQVPDGFETFQLSAGDYVEVTGSEFNNNNNYLVASRVVEKSGPLELSEFEDAEVEGIIAGDPVFLNATDGHFLINGQSVAFSPATSYQGGVATDLASGVKVEVEGEYFGGALVAERIAFDDKIELEANVEAVNPDGSFTLVGLPEITVSHSASHTEYGETVQPLFQGQHIKIRARVIDESAGVVLLATQMETSEEVEKVVLQGPVSNPDSSIYSLAILGVTISELSSFDLDDQPDVTAEQFFAQVESGDLVEAEGTAVGDVLDWIAVELDD